MNVRATKERDKELGDAIKTQRLLHGMTRHELAGKIGVTHQQLQKYEHGVNRITVTRIEDIARVLDVPLSKFLDTENTCDGEMGRLALEYMRKFIAIQDRRQQIAVHKLVTTIVAAQGASGVVA